VTKPEFLDHLSGFFADLRKLTDSKGVEYANSDDQLANFKRLSARVGIEPEKVNYVFLTKHLDSIEHAIRTGKTLSEPLRGRCLDAVLYLILLSALDHEKNATPLACVKTPSERLGLDPLPPLVQR
jgi:hypothetical protein